MEEEILTKEFTKKLMEIEGEIRGIDLKSDGDFVFKEKGEEGLKKVEEEVKKNGYPIEYKKIKTGNFYPAGFKALSLLAIKKALGFDNKKIEEMGAVAVKIPFLLTIFTKYFSPLPRFFFRETPKIWRKFWTRGEFIPLELNEEKKFAIIKMKDFNLHPIYCVYLKGYFSTFTRFVTGSHKITCEETRCFFRGNEDHEYLIKWE